LNELNAVGKYLIQRGKGLNYGNSWWKRQYHFVRSYYGRKVEGGEEGAKHCKTVISLYFDTFFFVFENYRYLLLGSASH
jgi:hypothetical protein